MSETTPQKTITRGKRERAVARSAPGSRHALRCAPAPRPHVRPARDPRPLRSNPAAQNRLPNDMFTGRHPAAAAPPRAPGGYPPFIFSGGWVEVGMDGVDLGSCRSTPTERGLMWLDVGRCQVPRRPRPAGEVGCRLPPAPARPSPRPLVHSSTRPSIPMPTASLTPARAPKASTRAPQARPGSSPASPPSPARAERCGGRLP